MDLPEQRLISARGQLESAWPVSGSILVHEDVAYFAAGRQSFIDGGIVVYGLNPATGEVLHRRRMFGPLDERGFHILAPGKFRSRGFKSGIFSSENGLLYIRHQAFQPDLTPLEPEELKASHLIPSAGFLDDVPQHRTYWTIDTDLRYGGSNQSSGAGPQGDICVVDGNTYYEIRGYLPGRHSNMTPTKGFTLYSGERVREGQGQTRRGFGIPGFGQWRKRWSKQVPLTGRALILAGNTLVAAGAPLAPAFGDPELSKAFAGAQGRRDLDGVEERRSPDRDGGPAVSPGLGWPRRRGRPVCHRFGGRDGPVPGSRHYPGKTLNMRQHSPTYPSTRRERPRRTEEDQKNVWHPRRMA